MVYVSKILIGIVALSLCSSSLWASEGSKQQANIQTVRAFYQKAINDKDFKAAEAYLGDTYTQHNPKAADGKKGLKSFIQYLKAKAPKYHSEVKRVIADGNYVVLHVHNTPAPGLRGKAIVDIFRLDNGKIVEHWDVIQAIPETAANTNGMF